MNKYPKILAPVILVLTLLIVLSIWWFPWITKGHTPLNEFGYGLIWGDWLSDRLHLVVNHEIPEWNPNNVLGINYIARDPFNNPLSLGNIFKFLFSDPKAEWLSGLFFYLLILGVGTYFFLKSQGISKFWAFLGAILIMIYPKWVDDIYHGPGKFVAGYSMTIWVLLTIEIMFKSRPKLYHYMILGLLASAIFLGSGAWVSIYLSYLIIPWYLFKSISFFLKMPQKRNLLLAKNCLGIAFSLIIALGISSYLLFPLLDGLRLSQRTLYSPPVGYGIADFSGLIFPWVSWLFPKELYGLPLLPLPTTVRFFFGILAVPLFMLIISKKELRQKFTFFWVWPSVIFILFSQPANKFFPLAAKIEQLLGAQSSENFLFFNYMVCFAVLLMAGCNHLFGSLSNKDKQDKLNSPTMHPSVSFISKILIAIYTCALIGFLSIAISTHVAPQIFNNLMSHFKGLSQSVPILLRINAIFFTYFYTSLFFAISFVFILRIFQLLIILNLRFFPKEKAAIVLGILMISDSLIVVTQILPPFTDRLDTAYSASLPQNKFICDSISPIQRTGTFSPYEKTRTKSLLFREKTTNLQKSIPPFSPAKWVSIWNSNVCDSGYIQPLYDPATTFFPVTLGRQAYTYHESLLPDYFFSFDSSMNNGNPRFVRQSWNAIWDPSSPLLNMAGIEYLFWFDSLSLPNLELVGRYPLGNGYIYHNTSAVPKAFLVDSLEFLESRTAVLNRMKEPTFEGNKIAVAEDHILAKNFRTFQKADSTISDTVVVTEYACNTIRVRANASKKSLLVISDLFFPYWSAAIDGTQSTIYKVNCAFRGIIIEPGNHEVVLKYRNPAFHSGLKISVISFCCTALILAMLLGHSLFRRRKIPS